MTPAALNALLQGDDENFVAACTPGGIEAQEKRGQPRQAELQTLPIKGTASCRPTWEKLGFVFGEGGDDLFVDVKFPPGWKERPTDHSMWSELLDNKDRVRGMIFYKAAFYDRSANVSLSRRFNTTTQPIEGWEAQTRTGRFIGVVLDGKNLIFQTEPTEPEPAHSTDGKNWKLWLITKDQKAKEAQAWLAERYPNWQDVTAYWE